MKYRNSINIIGYILFISLVFTLSSCNEYTKYKKPDVDVPAQYRGAPADAKPSDISFGQLYWGDLIKDGTLKELMNTALVNNYDVLLAAEKILEAEAKYGISRAGLYPVITGEALNNSQRYSHNAPVMSVPDLQHYTQLDLNLAYEFDFWGKLRRTADAARADVLATQEARNTVLLTLVSDVASGYFQLRELDLELEISNETLKNRLESLRLVTAREKYGKATMLDVDQAKSLVLQVQTAITGIELKIGQQEDYLSFLLGKNPGQIPRGLPLPEQLANLTIPPGIPSSLLYNRPDIRQAEQSLIAAGARVDAARDVFFPQITLTANDGTLSTYFSNLMKSESAIWQLLPQLVLPIFDGGKIKSNVRMTESQRRQAVISYMKTVKGAFRDVSDSLIGYQQQKIYVSQQKEYTDTSADQARLSNLRYIGGVTSYLEVLDSEQQYYDSEIQLAQANLAEIQYILKLYKALGGGWQQKPVGSNDKVQNPNVK